MKPTHISHKTNMSYIALQSALAHLIATGQVVESGQVTKHSRKMYSLTVRGKASAKAIRALDEALKPLSDGF